MALITNINQAGIIGHICGTKLLVLLGGATDGDGTVFFYPALSGRVLLSPYCTICTKKYYLYSALTGTTVIIFFNVQYRVKFLFFQTIGDHWCYFCTACVISFLRVTVLSGTAMQARKHGVTAHFVAPAQFVAGDKLCLRWRHMLSPPCTI